MEVDAKEEHDKEWRAYCERVSQLEKQHGQAFSMIQGQFMQVLLDNMKYDTDWYNTSESYDPLTLLNIIEKKLAQTKDDIDIQQCTINSLHCMSSINTT